MNTHATTPGWVTHSRLKSFRRRVLEWTEQDINSGWEDIIVVQGAAELGIAGNDPELIEWAARWLDLQLEAGVREQAGLVHRQKGEQIVTGVYLNDYCGNWGYGFAAAAILPARNDERYRNAILTVADFILEKSPRAADGCIVHGGFTTDVWVDTLYYCAPPLAQAWSVSGTQAYATAAVEQCLLHAKHLRSDSTALWHHDANPETGTRTVNLWARGLGWSLCALADTLRTVPDSTPGYEEALYHYRSLAEGIVRLQHSNGMWRVMPENPDAYLETSGTAMMLTGLMSGIRSGWLQPYVVPMVERGLRELETWVDAQGRLMGSQHPAGRGNWDSFKLVPTGEDTYATGFMLRALAAWQDLGTV